MKRNEVMALIATTILMFAVCLSASAKGKRNVERGMTKQEVIAILGEPKLTSFDMYVEGTKRSVYLRESPKMGEEPRIEIVR